jgi:hypothetical protein
MSSSGFHGDQENLGKCSENPVFRDVLGVLRLTTLRGEGIPNWKDILYEGESGCTELKNSCKFACRFTLAPQIPHSGGL